LFFDKRNIMRHFIYLYFLIFLLLILSCGKGRISDFPDLQEVEEYVSKTQDHRAVFTYEQYEELLNLLDDTNFIVLPIHEFIDSINDNKIMFGLRHDIDCHPFRALEMAKMEHKHNFRATYFVLPTADYYGKYNDDGFRPYKCMDEVYKELHSYGSEIGIHNDLLVVMIEHGLDPIKFNDKELEHFKSIGINIYGCVAHGSDLASKLVPNFEIFSDFAKSDSVEYQGVKYRIGEHSMKEFGFEYESNFLNNTKEFSDGGGHFYVGDFDEVIRQIKEQKKGARILLLAHPVWWGKKAE
jgi:hypothetical protein